MILRGGLLSTPEPITVCPGEGRSLTLGLGNMPCSDLLELEVGKVKTIQIEVLDLP